MQSDLKSLTETGGSVPIEKEIKIAKEDYLFQEQKQAAEIKPPELEISSAPQAPEAVLPPQKIGSVEMFRAPSQVEFSQAAVIVEDKINPRLIIGLGAGLVLILGLSVGFWMIYPKITQPPVAVSPSQTPLPTAQPTPSPSPEAPSIILKIQAQKFPLALAALDADELSQKLKVEMLLPEATSTLISFEPKLAGGNEYLPGSDLIKIISPNSLISFKSLIDKNYLMLGFWESSNRPSLSLVLSTKPESIDTAKSIAKSWESANMEEYFPVIFLPQIPEKRKAENFKDVIIKGIPARIIVINRQTFVYAFINNYLVISPSEKSFELIATNLQ